MAHISVNIAAMYFAANATAGGGGALFGRQVRKTEGIFFKLAVCARWQRRANLRNKSILRACFALWPSGGTLFD